MTSSLHNPYSSDQLPIDRFGSESLCMDQYKKLIGTCRIPAKNIDRLHLYNKTSHHHIAVFYRNNVRDIDSTQLIDSFFVL